MVNAVKILEVAGPTKSASPVCFLFQRLQKHCFFIQHVRAHTGLPGPLSEGNDKADQWARLECIFLSSTLEEGKGFS